MGDGRVDSAALLAHRRARGEALHRASTWRRSPTQSGSVISAVLFGALAGSGVLPFAAPAVRGDDRARRRRRRSRACAPSTPASRARRPRAGAGERARGERLRRLRARRAVGGDRVGAGARAACRPPHRRRAIPTSPRSSSACATSFPAEAQAIVVEGVRRTDRLAGRRLRAALPRSPRPRRAPPRQATPPRLLRRDRAPPRALDVVRGHDPRRRAEDAGDALRARARRSAGRGDGQVLAIDEYMHPRLQEICETLPAGLGRWLERPGWPRRLVERWTREGPGRDDQLAVRLPAALCGRRAAPLSAPQTLRFAVESAAHRRVAGARSPASPRSTPRSPSRSRNASAWSRATATRTSAAGATSAC